MDECYVLQVKFRFDSKPFLRVYEKYGQALTVGRDFYLDPEIEYVNCYLCSCCLAFDCRKDCK